jgi:hypothetical protein
VLLGLDLTARPQPGPKERRAHGLAESRLGQDQEIVLSPSPHDERRDDPRLRGQQEGRARGAELQPRDVVRHHAVEERDRVGPAQRDEVPRPWRDL